MERSDWSHQFLVIWYNWEVLLPGIWTQVHISTRTTSSHTIQKLALLAPRNTLIKRSEILWCRAYQLLSRSKVLHYSYAG